MVRMASASSEASVILDGRLLGLIITRDTRPGAVPVGEDITPLEPVPEGTNCDGAVGEGQAMMGRWGTDGGGTFWRPTNPWFADLLVRRAMRRRHEAAGLPSFFEHTKPRSVRRSRPRRFPPAGAVRPFGR